MLTGDAVSRTSAGRIACVGGSQEAAQRPDVHVLGDGAVGGHVEQLGGAVRGGAQPLRRLLHCQRLHDSIGRASCDASTPNDLPGAAATGRSR